jgi:hypothetical protein
MHEGGEEGGRQARRLGLTRQAFVSMHMDVWTANDRQSYTIPQSMHASMVLVVSSVWCDEHSAGAVGCGQPTAGTAGRRCVWGACALIARRVRTAQCFSRRSSAHTSGVVVAGSQAGSEFAV